LDLQHLLLGCLGCFGSAVPLFATIPVLMVSGESGILMRFCENADNGCQMEIVIIVMWCLYWWLRLMWQLNPSHQATTLIAITAKVWWHTVFLPFNIVV